MTIVLGGLRHLAASLRFPPGGCRSSAFGQPLHCGLVCQRAEATCIPFALDPAPLGPWGLAIAVLVGMVVGSFLNVVIHRLPLMLERRWAADCAALQARG